MFVLLGTDSMETSAATATTDTVANASNGSLVPVSNPDADLGPVDDTPVPSTAHMSLPGEVQRAHSFYYYPIADRAGPCLHASTSHELQRVSGCHDRC